MPIPIKTKAEFDGYIKGDKLVAVDFYADWCGPCKVIAPFYEELSKEHTDVVFLKVDGDLDECYNIVNTYNVTGYPTFLFFKSGKLISEATVVGVNKEGLKNSVVTYK